MIKIDDLKNLFEGENILVKVGDDYNPVEIKFIVDKSLSNYVVGTDGVAYQLDQIYTTADQ